MPDIAHAKDLRERRAKIHKDMTDIAALAQKEDRKLSSDERTKFDGMKQDMADLKERIDDLESLELSEREMDAPAAVNRGQYALDDGRVTDRMPADRDKIITRRDTDMAFRAFSLGRFATHEMREAAKKCQLDLESPEMDFRLLDTQRYNEMRRGFREDGIVYRATTAQSKGTDAAGGYTVPTELVTTIEEALLAIRGMRQVATVIRTDGGHDLNIPTADDTATVSAVLAENTAETVDNLVFAQVTMRAAKYGSGLILASVELMQDTAVDLVGYIGRAIGTRHARGTNRDYTTGSTATTSPRGVLRDTFEGYAATTATGGDIGVRPLVELKRSVDIEYRDLPGAGFMAHDGVIAEMEYLVDSNGQPLWRPGMVAGEPDTLLGHPLYVNNRMVSSTTGAGAKTVIFGALSKYIIRDVTGGQLIRFNERYMEKLQFGWLGFMRTDGKVLLASTRTASKPIAHLKGTT